MILELAATSAGVLVPTTWGNRLLADVTQIGTYQYEHPLTGKFITLPKYEIREIGVVTNPLSHGREKVARDFGIVRTRLSPDILGVKGLTEYRERQSNIQQVTFSVNELRKIRDATNRGIPSSIQLQWEREIHGPQSPTIEQEIAAKADTPQNGLTFLVSAPTAGNLLIITHGFYFSSSGTEGSSCSTGGAWNDRGFSCASAFEMTNNLLDKIASGSEGTSIVVTHDSATAQENAGVFTEISGMVGFIAGSFVAGNAGAAGTSQATGNASTGAINDAILIASLNAEQSGSPTGFAVDNSFVITASASGTQGQADVAVRQARRTVAVAGSYGTTFTWTNNADRATVIGAYEIASATAPNQVTGLSVSAYSPEKFKLSWSTPGDGGSPITGYKIEVSDDGVGWSVHTANTGNTNTTAYPGGYNPATLKYWRVSAINAIGTGAASTSASATTPNLADAEQVALINFNNLVSEPTVPFYGAGTWSQQDIQQILSLPIDPLVAEIQGTLLLRQFQHHYA